MPYYDNPLTNQEYLVHLQRHHIFRNVTRKITYCRICYSVEHLSFHQIPTNWPIFWNWFFNRYPALNYTSYSIHAFSQLDNTVDSGNPAICLALIKSIEFSNTLVPLEEITYFTTYLYVQTNKFQVLPTNHQVAAARHLYQAQYPNQVPSLTTQFYQFQAPDPTLDSYLESIPGLFQTPPNTPNLQPQQQQQPPQPQQPPTPCSQIDLTPTSPSSSR